jgi:hypothetical protein
MKKYRSLDEVYITESLGKALPPLPRQLLERVKISVQTDTGETQNFTVSDSWYNKAIKDKLAAGSQNLDTYYELIHLRCIDAGILPVGHDDINSKEVKTFYDYIFSITGPDEINSFFEKFVDEGQKAAAVFVAEIDKNEKFNVLNLLSGFYGVKFVYSEDVFKLRPLTAAQKTRGAPGPGEAFIAFFFFSKKPEVGDLSIPAGNRFIEIEIKKQNGRIGKGLNIESGKLGRRLYPDLKTLDTTVLKEFVEFYNLQNVGDILLGNKTFPGITGVRAIPNQNLDNAFFNQSLDFFIKTFNSLDALQQYIGVIQMKNYFSKIKQFDSILIFTETGLAIGFKREYVLNNSTTDVATNLLSKQVYLKRKTEAGVLFDSDGFRIVI